LVGPGIRLPLTPLSPHCHETVRSAMRAAGLSIKSSSEGSLHAVN
jgi:4-hydroxy-tetrahydrodipicolinate synthase